MDSVKNLRQLAESLEGIQNSGLALINQYSDPDTLKQMTPEQRELMKDAKVAMTDLSNLTLEERQERLKQMIDKYGINSSTGAV